MDKLLKRGVVLTLHPDQQSENFKYFEAGYEGGSDTRTDGYYMTKKNFEDFGSPETITVVVVAGVLQYGEDQVRLVP